MNQEQFKTALKNDAKIIGVDLNNEMLDMFYQYKNLVLEWNEKINLTAITEDRDFLIKHFVDSMTIIKYLEKERTIIDIGTGAGLPGIPIKIASKGNEKITLLDSLNKRIQVLEKIISQLKLEDIELIHGRAEEKFKMREYREKYDIAVSRAVANLSVLVELMMPAVKVGGKCICMKGNNIEEELRKAKTAIKILGGKIEAIDKVVLPELNLERNIIVIKKENQSPKQYPRKPGTPQKMPIK